MPAGKRRCINKVSVGSAARRHCSWTSPRRRRGHEGLAGQRRRSVKAALGSVAGRTTCGRRPGGGEVMKASLSSAAAWRGPREAAPPGRAVRGRRPGGGEVTKASLGSAAASRRPHRAALPGRRTAAESQRPRRA
eukprot:2412963-Heterocapsa_arctica.AAC.1